MKQHHSNMAKRHEKKAFKKIGKQLLKKSSLYPLSQLVHAKSYLRKIWWMFVLLVGILGSIYQIAAFLLKYLEYPVVVDLNVENKFVLDFPAVTVCNLNRMKSDFETCLMENLTFHQCMNGEGNLGSLVPPSIISERRSSASCSKQFSGQKYKNMDDLMSLLTKYTTVKYEDRRAFGYPMKELIAFCSFNGKLCEEDHFAYFQSLQYGNCFTFKKKKNNPDVLKVSVNSKTTELEMTLDLDYATYLHITPSLGARIVIHDPKDDPNPEEGGINISPGFQTLVRVKQICHRRLKAPYTDKCIDYVNNPDVSGRNQRECIQICIQEQNLDNCSCVDPTISGLSDKKQCNMSNSTDACCLDHVIDYIAVNGLQCKCPPACVINNYEKKLSFSKWPSPSYKCGACKGKYLQPGLSMASVKVLYSTFEQITYRQCPVFQDSQLYSNLGSLLSLWLGLSLLIIFEVTEMVTYIFLYYYKRN